MHHTRECLAEGKQESCPICGPINERAKRTQFTCVVSEDGTLARFEVDGPCTWLHIEYPSPNGTYSSESALSLVLDTAQLDRYLATLGYKRRKT